MHLKICRTNSTELNTFQAKHGQPHLPKKPFQRDLFCVASLDVFGANISARSLVTAHRSSISVLFEAESEIAGDNAKAGVVQYIHTYLELEL